MSTKSETKEWYVVLRGVVEDVGKGGMVALNYPTIPLWIANGRIRKATDEEVAARTAKTKKGGK